MSAMTSGARKISPLKEKKFGHTLLGWSRRGSQGIVHAVETADGERLALKVLTGKEAEQELEIERIKVIRRLFRATPSPADELVSIDAIVNEGPAERGYVMPLADDVTGQRADDVRRFPPNYNPWTLECLFPRSLHDAQQQRKPGVRDLLTIASRLAQALGHLHRAGYSHGDVKLGHGLQMNGVLKLGDFGSLHGRGIRPGPTQGTLGYLPPSPGERKAPDQRSDVYALGQSVFALATGEEPFGWRECLAPDVHLHVLNSRLQKMSVECSESAVLPQVKKMLEGACSYDPKARISLIEFFVQTLLLRRVLGDTTALTFTLPGTLLGLSEEVRQQLAAPGQAVSTRGAFLALPPEVRAWVIALEALVGPYAPQQAGLTNGSILLHVELTVDQAASILSAWKAGKLAHLGLVDVKQQPLREVFGAPDRLPAAAVPAAMPRQEQPAASPAKPPNNTSATATEPTPRPQPQAKETPSRPAFDWIEWIEGAWARLVMGTRNRGVAADIAEDIVQEAFLRALTITLSRKLQFDSEMDFRHWISLLISNGLVDDFRRRRRRPECSFEVLGMDKPGMLPGEFVLARPDTRFEHVPLLLECLQRLGPTDRQILELHYLEGLTLREVLLRLKVDGPYSLRSYQAVQKQLHAARERLREILLSEGLEPHDVEWP